MSVRTRTSRIALALALLVTLDGCVAAAIPVLAGAAGAGSQLKHKTEAAQRVTVTTPAPDDAPASPLAAATIAAPRLSPTTAAVTEVVRPQPVVASARAGPMGPPAPPPFENAAVAAREPYRSPSADAVRIAVAPPSAPVRKVAARSPPRAARVRTPRAPAPRLATPIPVPIEVAVAAQNIEAASSLTRIRGDYADFAQYAVAQAQPMSGGGVRTSVVYDPASSLQAPRYLGCDQLAPAVLIDLDPAAGAFSPAHAGAAAPGLGDALAAVRAAGLVVLWATDLPVTLAPEVYRTLRASGLDPEGTDRLLLNRTSDERKELRKRAAAQDYCIVAVAGDKRGDFAELYDYLRNPVAAAALEPRFGAGWFMVPPALGAN